MPKPRGRNARHNSATFVGRGTSGYKVRGERYVMPAMLGLSCPACEHLIRHHKRTGMFVCTRCEGQFTSVQMQQSIKARNTMRHRQENEAYAAMQAKLAEEARVRRALIDAGNTSVVYYIRFRDTVKIGTSTDVAKRLTMHPWEELVAIEPGGQTVERRRHKELRSSRLDGEWFELTPEVREQIEDVNRVNATWYANVFSCMGPLPVAKRHAKFPALADYPVTM